MPGRLLVDEDGGSQAARDRRDEIERLLGARGPAGAVEVLEIGGRANNGVHDSANIKRLSPRTAQDQAV